MARPSNPLDYFESSSYYHSLIVTNSTNVITQMSDGDFPWWTLTKNDRGVRDFSLEKYVIVRRGEGSSGDTSDYTVVPSSNRGGESEAFVIITTGSRDAELSIEELKWTNIFHPNYSKTQGTQTFTTSAIDGTMQIIEPRGARFFQFIDRALDLLGVDPAGAIFAIKTFFTGIPIDRISNSGRTQVLANIPPLAFNITDIQANFQASGGTYDVSFVGLNNGTSKLPQFINPIGNDSMSVKGYKKSENGFTEQENLYNTLKNLQNKTNEKYEQYVEQAKKDNPNLENEYRLIGYEFIIDDAYQSDEYLIDQGRPQAGETNEEVTIVFQPGDTLENAIQRIMDSCSQVAKDANNPTSSTDETEEYYTYKIVTTIESRASNNIVGNSVERSQLQRPYMIKYKIKRYPLQKYKSDEKGNAINAVRSQPPPGSVIEYDYIFTGRNIDIKEFDINMDTGLVFFMEMKNSSNLPSTKESVDKRINANKGSTSITPDHDVKNNRNLKLFLPPHTNRDPKVNHMKDPHAITSFRSMLNNSYAVATAATETKIVIRGNPTFLANMTFTPEQLIRENKEAYREGEEIFVNWPSQPGFVKLNIKMPSGDPDSPDDYEPFWYQGFFTIITIRNVFADGVFEQEMELIPTFVQNNEQEETKTTEEEETDQTPSEKLDLVKDFESGFVVGAPSIGEGSFTPVFFDIINPEDDNEGDQ